MLSFSLSLPELVSSEDSETALLDVESRSLFAVSLPEECSVEKRAESSDAEQEFGALLSDGSRADGESSRRTERIWMLDVEASL